MSANRNIADDPLYKALDELYARGWADRHKGRDYDPRGTIEWELANSIFADMGSNQDVVREILQKVINELENGFVKCETCWSQEDTATLDCMPDIREAHARLKND